MTTAVGDLINRARAHDPRFTVERHSNRVALSFLSTRHRDLLKLVAPELKDRISQAREIAAVITGSLVGVDENGAAYSVSTQGDGYAAAVDATTGAIYLDLSQPISIDPFTEGFPLPPDSLHLVGVYATISESEIRQEVILRPQKDFPRLSGSGSELYAFVNGWRLIPLRNPPPSGTTADASRWSVVTAVTVVWVDTPIRFVETGSWEDQVLVLPDIYADALEFELAAFFAQREFSRDAEAFPAAVAQALSSQASKQLQMAKSGVQTDHRGLKVQTTRRNR